MKKIDWSQWFLFVIGVVVVECVSVYLLRKAYPGEEMKIMGWALLILVIGFSAYATWRADEPDNSVRQVGIATKCVLALLGVGGLYGHSAMSRELATSRAAKVEYKQQVSEREAVEKARTEREIALKQAEAEQLAAQARLENAQSQKLRLLPPSQRRAVHGQPSKPALPSQSAIPATSITTPSEDQTTLAEPRLEATVREDWIDFFQVINFLQILIAVVGALAVSAVLHWDRHGIIGVPDWIERIWHSGANGQQYIRANYPDYVPMLEGGGITARPGKATT
jgi:hypothetical protein